MTVTGKWRSCTLPFSPERLLGIIEEAKRKASKVSFSSILNGMPKSSDYQSSVIKEGPDGKPAPITPQDWSTLVLPGLESLGVLTEDIKKQYEEARAWAVEHPLAAALVVVVVAGVLIVLFFYPHLLYKPVLNAIGFASKGVSPNSIASAVQSWIGSVQVGSSFACSQSAAMVGYGASTLATTTRTVTGTMIAGGVALRSRWQRQRERPRSRAKL
ncbi:hypothetical protein QBC45DRAFT_74823 [Copromyces sp. CBS 386.78]|nr:hypothetical protein QBC45DRAFT_74823 [Copromyces sp. CBS 386.78]